MLILKIKKSDKNYFDSFKIIKLFTKYMDEVMKANMCFTL